MSSSVPHASVHITQKLFEDALAGARREVQQSAPRDVLPDGLIHDYECVRVLGRGGQAIVFEGRKVVPPKRGIDRAEGEPQEGETAENGNGEGDNGDGDNEEASSAGKGVGRAIKVFDSDYSEELFKAEVELMSRFSHPNIVKLFDFGDCIYLGEQRRYLAMELVEDAKTLEAHFECEAAKDPSGAVRLACNLISQVCQGLHHAHLRFAIHRDLKPHNILVGADGVPKITDFGVAQDVRPLAPNAPTAALPNGFFGTLRYSSPEHHRGRTARVDPRSDVYSLGVVLFELLAKRSPYNAAGVGDLIDAISKGDAQSLGAADDTYRGGAYRDLDAIIGKALELDPAHRYQSASEFETDINRYLAYEPVTARKPPPHERLIKFWRRSSGLTRGLIGATLLATLIAAAGLAANYRSIVRENQAAAHRDYVGFVSQIRRAGMRSLPQQMLRLLDSVHPDQPNVHYDFRGWEWWYLKRLSHSERLRLVGARGSLTCVVYSPDGRAIAAGSEDGIARVWDSTTGELTRELDGHASGVSCIAYSHDGRLLATGGGDSSIVIWDSQTGKRQRILSAHAADVDAVAFHPSGKILASGGGEGMIVLHNLERDSPEFLATGAMTITGLAFSPDGRLLAASTRGGDQYSLQLWDPLTHQIVRRLEANTPFLQFSDDGSHLLYNGINDVRLTNVEDGTIEHQISHASALTDLVLLDTTITTKDGTVRPNFVKPSGGFDTAMLLPGGRQMLTFDVGRVQIWSLPDEKVLHSVSLQKGPLAVSPDGMQVAIACGDRSIRVWPIGQETDGYTLPGHSQRISSLAFHPDGKTIASGSSDQSVGTWNLASRKALGLWPHTTTTHDNTVRRIAYSPDGRLLASVGGKKLAVMDWATGRLQFVKNCGELMSCVAWSPDGNQLAVGCWNDGIHLIDVNTGRLSVVMEGHLEDVYDVAYLADNRIISCGADGFVRIWDAKARTQLHAFQPDLDGILECLAVSKDGRRVAIGSAAAQIAIWDLQTLKSVAVLRGHAARITGLAFSPDGRRLASTTGSIANDGTVIVWDTSSFLELIALPGAYSVTFSPNGKLLATGGTSNRIRIYSTEPVDNKPYRINIGDALPPAIVRHEEESKLRIFGAFFASRDLGGIFGAPPVIEPDDGRKWLMVVLSLPSSNQMLDDLEYEKFADSEKSEGVEHVDLQENVTVKLARKFELASVSGKSAAAYGGIWPPGRIQPAGVTDVMYRLSSSRVKVHERNIYAIAFEVDPNSIEWPVEISYGDLKATLEGAFLPVDPRYEPSPMAKAEFVLKFLERSENDAGMRIAHRFRDGDPTGETAFELARGFAVVVKYMNSLDELDEAALERREMFSVFAIESLEKAMQSGFADVVAFDKDPHLPAFADRADFQDFAKRFREKVKTQNKKASDEP